jgi:AraC family transcriptional regulator of adaptative response / DNA-3-methyladenine glycosylase II
LIETTDLTMTDIAYAAGFGSTRQFNDTIREVFASSPSDLRSRAGSSRRAADIGTVSVKLPARLPFAGRAVLEFLGARAVPGVETWDGHRYARTLELPRGHGIVDLAVADGGIEARFRLTDWRDLAPAVGRVRRLLDLDADPTAIDESLAGDPSLAPMVAATPGLRVAGSVDAYETLVRAVVGQQVSVAGARTVLGRITAEIGQPSTIEHRELSHVFPSMERLATASASVFPMPRSRAETLQRCGQAALDGLVVLDPGADREAIIADLVALKGIGPWTANYVIMRGLGDPDVFLVTDLGVKHALAALDLDPAQSERWKPWRSYAMHHLWNTL